MRRTALEISCALIAASMIPAVAPSRALGAELPLRCATVAKDGQAFRFCKGRVETQDGSARLHAAVTLPARGRGPFPLVVLMHGLGGSKTSYESNTIKGSGARHHLNNLWFASRGYAVLNYTSRGFDTRTLDGRHEIDGRECVNESVQSVDHDPDLYGDDPACRPQLSHLDHEVSDAQDLISRLVDGTLLDADGVTVTGRRIGVVGVSYGGGPTWILTRRNVWRTPQGNRVRLAAAVPIITWTDLVYALLPNGRGRDDVVAERDVGAREAQPPGVFKQSFATALYLAMNESSSEPFELTDYLNAWYDRIHEGEPYNDRVVADAIHKLLTKRSAYYIPKRGAFHTPTLAVQGFTDFLFSAIEPLRMYQRLRDENDGAPMSMYFGDWGHPLSQNRADETAYIARLVNRWLDYYLMGNGDNPSGVVEARVQECASDTMGQLYRAATWEGLQTADEPMELAPSGQIGSPADDTQSADLDPVPGATPRPRNGCAVTSTEVDPDNIAAEVDLPAGFKMMGMPEITLTAHPSAPDLYVEARLWDVDPDANEQTLADRGVYRLGGSTDPQEVRFQLNGNAYTFEAGHRMKLELTADDSPSFLEYRPSAGMIDVSGVSLSVPGANEAMRVP
jgi:predicted acyl esterase